MNDFIRAHSLGIAMDEAIPEPKPTAEQLSQEFLELENRALYGALEQEQGLTIRAMQIRDEAMQAAQDWRIRAEQWQGRAFRSQAQCRRAYFLLSIVLMFLAASVVVYGIWRGM